MTQPTTTARVHRFHDKVAISIGEEPTVYLTAPMAKKVAAIIEACRLDIERQAFTDSQFGPATITDTTPTPGRA